MDDNDVERDDALDYIIYQDITNEDQHRGSNPRSGCLSMVVLLGFLSTSALFLIYSA
jgi:hypothetical protein